MASSSASVGSPEEKRNRLADEKSPYLLQHATNPVDWYPWCEAAFSKSRAENKPIFLSVGYSTCHWCHVMERESFENQRVADMLNKHFVSIKVDREERPDVDKVYMTFIQATQGGGGWPMSVFLTPDLKPFLGGTYFPPEDSRGRPGFITLLNAIRNQWEKDHMKIKEQMEPIMDALQKAVSESSQDPQLPGTSCIQRAAETLEKRFDRKHGGFGGPPKFPQPVILDLLLRVYARYPSSDMGESALKSVVFTLKTMSNGGMHDHISQGFHRYSTDTYWHVPHFEKMLYDQAQLATTYLDTYQITKEEKFKETACDILSYVSRDLSDQDGGFYSAEDADSYLCHGDTEKKEGAFCVWSWDEIHSILLDPLPGGSSDGKTLADLFSSRYGVERNGNVQPNQDPHGELRNQNVLIIRKSIEDVSKEFSLDQEQVRDLLTRAREKLYEVRAKRPKPHRDEKILTAWNGLMISGFARASQVLGDAKYLTRAEKAAAFIRDSLYQSETSTLLRSAYRDEKGTLSVGTVEGFADDYAFTIRGLLDLYEASHASNWLEWACQLQQRQDELFLDSTNGGYFSTSGQDETILLKMKEAQDGAEPSANSVSASNLLRLSSFLNKPELRLKSENIFKTFHSNMTEHPAAFAGLVSTFISYLQKPKQLIIVGSSSSQETLNLLSAVHSFFVPNKTLIMYDPASPSTFLQENLPLLNEMTMLDEQSTVYLCEEYTCSAPTNSVKELKRMLDTNMRL